MAVRVAAAGAAVASGAEVMDTPRLSPPPRTSRRRPGTRSVYIRCRSECTRACRAPAASQCRSTTACLAVSARTSSPSSTRTVVEEAEREVGGSAMVVKASLAALQAAAVATAAVQAAAVATATAEGTVPYLVVEVVEEVLPVAEVVRVANRPPRGQLYIATGRSRVHACMASVTNRRLSHTTPRMPAWCSHHSRCMSGHRVGLRGVPSRSKDACRRLCGSRCSEQREAPSVACSLWQCRT